MSGTQSYAIQLTAPGVASDGTTQPAGTIINFVMWDGHTPYTPHDYAGNTTDVTMILATAGMTAYAPISTPAPSINNYEQDFAVVNGATAQLAYGTNLLILTGSGTVATYGVWLPPSPGVGDQVQVVMLGTFTITTLTVYDGSGNSLHAFSGVTAPKRTILGYTASGWQIIPN